MDNLLLQKINQTEHIQPKIYMLIHKIVWDEINRLHEVKLLKITPNSTYIVFKPIYAQFHYQKLVTNQILKTLLINYKGHRETIN